MYLEEFELGTRKNIVDDTDEERLPEVFMSEHFDHVGIKQGVISIALDHQDPSARFAYTS